MDCHPSDVQTIALKGWRPGEQILQPPCSLSPFRAARLRPGRGQLLPQITTCSESGGEK